jgi:hypothetical protein
MASLKYIPNIFEKYVNISTHSCEQFMVFLCAWAQTGSAKMFAITSCHN